MDQPSFGELEISYPDGRAERVALTQAVVRVGRGAEGNDVNLGDDQQISRQHAQFLCQPGQISVICMGQASLLVDGVRVGQQEEVALGDGATVTIGPLRLTLRYPAAPAAARVARTVHASGPSATADLGPPEPPAPEPPAPEPPAPAPQGSHLRVRLGSAQVAVMPGQTATLIASVEKRFGEVDSVSLRIDGIPAEWYSVAPEKVNLYPYSAEAGGDQADSRAELLISLHPPRRPDSAAGSYACVVTAQSSTRPHEPAGAPCSIDVQTFHQLAARLSPRRVSRRRQRFMIELDNQGNSALPLSLAGEDEDDLLRIELDRERVTLEPGARAAVAMSCTPPRRWIFGRPLSYRLSAIVTPDPPEVAPQTLGGVLVQPRLWAWLQLVPLLLLAALALGYVLFFLDDLRPPGRLARRDLISQATVAAQALPRDPIELSFERDGVVSTIAAAVGDEVGAGQTLAELRYYEQLIAVRKAEDGLERAQADLEAARRQQQREVRLAELDMQQAADDVADLQPGGANDPARAQQGAIADAQRQVDAAQREREAAAAAGSAAKLSAEDALAGASQALHEAEQRYSKAFWENDWVEQYGTDPNAAAESSTSTTGDSTTVVKSQPVKLNSVQRQAFKDALGSARRDLDAAQRKVDAAQRALDQARADEIRQNAAADEALQAAQQQAGAAAAGAGQPSPQLASAQIALEKARIRREAAGESGLEPFIKAVEAAQAAVDDARAQLENRTIRAPVPGVVLAVSVPISTSVQAAQPVVRLAVGGDFDLVAALSPEQIAALSPGQAVEVSLTRPDGREADGLARLTRMPAAAERMARFAVDPDLAAMLGPDAQARLRIPLIARPHALAAPQPYLRADGDSRYLTLRAASCPWSPTGRGLLMRLCERRVYVRPGPAVDGWVEIVDSYDEQYSLTRLEEIADQAAGAQPIALLGQ